MTRRRGKKRQSGATPELLKFLNLGWFHYLENWSKSEGNIKPMVIFAWNCLLIWCAKVFMGFAKNISDPAKEDLKLQYLVF